MIKSKVEKLLKPPIEIDPPREWEKDVSIGKWGGRVAYRYERDEWKDHIWTKNTNVVEIRLILDELIMFIKDDIIEKTDTETVKKALQQCYYCATNKKHKKHKNVFEYVADKAEEKRIERYMVSIKGIGEDIQERLKERFETLEELKKASKDELMEIPGIGEKKVRKIKKQPTI